MDHDHVTGEFCVMKVTHEGHQRAIVEIVEKMRDFEDESNRFIAGGDLQSIANMDSDLVNTRGVKPDALFPIDRNVVSPHRIVVEAGSRTSPKLDARI